MNALQVIEKDGQRVLTTKQLAESYETTEKVISNNFNRNKERYEEGKHYICLKGDDLKNFKGESSILGIANNVNQFYLWTERGTLLHAKSLNTDKAWEVYDYLVENYFRRKNNTYSTNQQLQIPFPDIVQSIQIIANDLKVNDASKIIMYTTLYKDYNLPTNFLPKYEFNGNRDMKPATELLKRFNIKLSAKAFNNLMIANGYLEERTRNSRADITKVKKYKALTEKGLNYGENAVCVQCQKETQPLYYADTFEELFDIVSGRNEIVV